MNKPKLLTAKTDTHISKNKNGVPIWAHRFCGRSAPPSIEHLAENAIASYGKILLLKIVVI